MAEFQNSAFKSKFSMPSENRMSDSKPESDSNGFVAIDIAEGGEVDFPDDPRTPVNKTLSRKGSQRGGERKGPDSAALIVAGEEKSGVLGHVAEDCEEGMLHHSLTPTAGIAGRSRRLSSRRLAPWRDPRRVLVFFATLSSVGTLILLYLTLFMGSAGSSSL